MNTTEISDTYTKLIYQTPELKNDLDEVARSVGQQARSINWTEHTVPLMFVEPQIDEISNTADMSKIRFMMNLIRAGYRQNPIIYDLKNRTVKKGHDHLVAYHLLGIKDIPVVGFKC